MHNHYSEEFVVSQKEALIKEKARLEEDLKSVAIFNEDTGKYVPKFEEINPDASEDADEETDETVDFGEKTAMANELIRTLTEVNAALKAVDSGTYGKCLECNDGYISEERLKAYPAAKSCIKCG